MARTTLRRSHLPTLLSLALLAMARPARAKDTPDAMQTSDGMTTSAPVSSNSVFVHVDARAGTELRTRDSVTDGWTTACVAPCDRLLPRDAHYQVVMPGKRPSRSFDLGRSGEHVELSVSPNRLGLALGLPLLALGAFSTYGGVKFLVSASGAPDSIGKNVGQFFGIVLLVGGAVEAIAGAVLPFVDTGTTISQSSRAREDARCRHVQTAAMPAPTSDGFLRTPTWSIASYGLALPGPTLPWTISATF